MTLIDSRPGIKAAYQALSAATGRFIDADQAITRLGPPLEEELAYWFTPEEIPEMTDRYREMYPAHAIEPTPAMPGAREAIKAVQALGGRAIVVTAKNTPNAVHHLEHLGIEPDAVIGWLWAEAKAGALREHGAQIYVGDHVGDVRGARTAGALSGGSHGPLSRGRTARRRRRRGPAGPHRAAAVARRVRRHPRGLSPVRAVRRPGTPGPPCAARRRNAARPRRRWRIRRP